MERHRKSDVWVNEVKPKPIDSLSSYLSSNLVFPQNILNLKTESFSFASTYYQKVQIMF